MDEIQSLLKSHYSDKDPSDVLEELRQNAQLPGEKANTFVRRAVTLRKRIAKMTDETGCPYDAELLKSTFFKSIFTGLRQNNIRMEIQGLLKSRTCSDPELLREVTIAQGNEEERIKKTKASASVNKVSVDDSSSEESDQQERSKTSKKREAKILTTVNKLSAQLENKNKQLENQNREIMSLREKVMGQSQQQQQQQQTPTPAAAAAGAPGTSSANRGSRRNRRPFFRCEACEERNSSFCAHCFKCGSDAHKRAECPN